MKQKLTELKEETDKSTIRFGSFNIFLSVIDRTNKFWEISNDIEGLYNIIKYLDITDSILNCQEYHTLLSKAELSCQLSQKLSKTISQNGSNGQVFNHFLQGREIADSPLFHFPPWNSTYRGSDGSDVGNHLTAKGIPNEGLLPFYRSGPLRGRWGKGQE